MTALELLHPDAVVARNGTDDLARQGLQQAAVLLHLPTFEASTRIVALDGRALAYALSERPSRRARMASVAARVPFGRTLLSKLVDTSVVFTPPGVVLLPWFPEADLHDVVIDTSRHGETRTFVLRHVRDGTLTGVAKVGAGPSVEPPGVGEAEALRTLAPVAAAAGLVVPTVLDERTVNGLPVTIESAVPGKVAADVIARRPSDAGGILERLTEHLARWNEQTFAGTSVAVHQDLTMANVLVDDERLGLVDWASSRPDGLPLTDFFYAALDARAAVDGYRDRVNALRECFSPNGDWFTRVGTLEAAVTRRLGIDSELADRAFMACWENHAANEQRRGEVGQFQAVLDAARGLR
jgi:phosphotransferase family enzyme